MPCRRRYSSPSRAAVLCITLATLNLNPAFAQRSAKDTDSSGTLYLVEIEGDALKFQVPASGRSCTEPNLVVITHGWYERQLWPAWTAMALARKVDRRQWRCGWCDWRGPAHCLRPSRAATIGRDSIGPQLGRRIVQLSRQWRHVHLIGHSAGAWVIHSAAEVVARETEADLHITFLDAYVPDGWDERVLGRLPDRSAPHIWIEHYFTRDLLNLTENILPQAVNVDVTAINPGFQGHKFPWHWYLATVAGQYTTDRRFLDRPVFCASERLTYGWARGREAGDAAWQQSVALAGDGVVHIQSSENRP